MYDPSLEVIKQYKTPVDEKGEHREYFLYKQEHKFLVECIGWKIKDIGRAGGNPIYNHEFDSEEAAIKAYAELISRWEQQKLNVEDKN